MIPYQLFVDYRAKIKAFRCYTVLYRTTLQLQYYRTTLHGACVLRRRTVILPTVFYRIRFAHRFSSHFYHRI